MARITASVYTSHVPAIGAAMDLGKDQLYRFAEALEDCAKVEKEPSREGRNKVDMILVSK